MKKILFVNEVYTFVFSVFGTLLFSWGLIMMYNATPDKIGRVVGVCSLGFFILLFIIILVISTEVIIFDEEKVVCVKLLKHVTIAYTSVKDIQTTDKHDMGLGGVTAVWKITDTNGQVIDVARFKRRKRWIDHIEAVMQNSKNEE